MGLIFVIIKSQGGGWKWLWNLIDHKTKFLIASHATENRAIEDARKLFARGKRIAKKRPAFIVTDGLPTYQDACRKEFYTPKAEKTNHVSLANVGVGQQRIGTGDIGRL
ncbi:unnamed protein product [marine sediment metagenome]|uniref:DDE domain-containing protein n=1 Tax=marine sediment metagenome TaxID=412755 RepID=X0YSX1_9ZZZZ